MCDMGPKNTPDFRASVFLKLSPEQGLEHRGPSHPAWEDRTKEGRASACAEGQRGREPLPEPGRKGWGAPVRPRRGVPVPRGRRRVLRAGGAFARQDLLRDARGRRRPPGLPQAAAPSASTPSIQAA